MNQQSIKSKFQEFKNLVSPSNGVEILDEDLKADLNLLETQIAGLITAYCNRDLNPAEKKLLHTLKNDLLKAIESIPAESK